MQKAADIREQVNRLGSSVQDTLGSTGRNVGEWFQALSPETKATLLRGLVGAGVGAAGLGGASALIPRDPEEQEPAISPALLGALLGGLGGAGLPLAGRLLSGDFKFPGESGKGVVGTVSDAAINPMVHHPALTAGLAGGGYMALGRGNLPVLQEAWGRARHAPTRGEVLRTAFKEAPEVGLEGLKRDLAAIPTDPAGMLRRREIGAKLRTAIEDARNRITAKLPTEPRVPTPLRPSGTVGRRPSVGRRVMHGGEEAIYRARKATGIDRHATQLENLVRRLRRTLSPALLHETASVAGSAAKGTAAGAEAAAKRIGRIRGGAAAAVALPIGGVLLDRYLQGRA